MFELVIGELDYIVGDYQLGDKLEKNILEWAMTSKSDAELKQRLNEYGDTWLRHIEETSK
jgi:hypothetical protein